MHAPRPVLYRNGSVYSPADPFATAMLVADGTVAWVGSEHAAQSLADTSMRIVDLQGALVAPGFVDSHVHTTETGIALESIDLSDTRSLQELLDTVSRAAGKTSGIVLGHGWDESRWPENRAPTAAELDTAGAGAVVYLARVDVHSAVVSGALAASLNLNTLDGWNNGLVVREAHIAARKASHRLTPSDRSARQTAALRHAAANGIVAVAEMGAPHISAVEDLLGLMELGGSDGAGPLPQILPYWGQRVSSAAELAEVCGMFGGRLAGLAGDLNVDGSIGSRTAALRDPYTDAADTSGSVYLDADDAGDHLAAATAAGVQAGFHVIGDAGLDVILQALSAVAEAQGIDAVRRARHRLEHVELADDTAIRDLVHYGITVSAQPGFDSRWGADGQLYSQRLGEPRSRTMNRIGSLLGAGVPVCLGSDSPVTRLDPWAAVRACIQHSNPAERISARAGFIAHTRAGWRAAGMGHPLLGQLVPGAPASYAVWEVEELMVQTPDSRVQSWSTDPRAGTPLLPAMDKTSAAPRCLETVHGGRTLYASPDTRFTQ